MARLQDYTFRHDGIIYTFTIEAQEATFQTKLNGRKTFKDVEVVRALVPSAYGVPKQENSDILTPDWLMMKDAQHGDGRPLFTDHYDRWKAGEAAASKGIPIAEFDALSPAQIKMLELSKVDTIEIFAQTDETLLAKLVGPEWRLLRDRAKALTGVSDNAELRATNERMLQQQDEIERLRQQIEALSAARTPEPRKRGKADAPQEEAA